jgi:hypothetical protein
MPPDGILEEILSPSAPVVRMFATGTVDADALSGALRARSFVVVDWQATGEPGEASGLLDTIFRNVVRDRLYSANWDALEERLGDIAAEAEQRVALIIANAPRFAQNDPDQWRIAMQVFSGIGEEWRRSGSVLRVIVLR